MRSILLVAALAIAPSLATAQTGSVDHGPSILRSASKTDPLSQSAPSAQPHRGVRKAIAGGVLGGVLGFWGGGMIGAKLEGPCHCDYPGFHGFIVGAPVGSIIGAIVGAKFF